jgi:hypothetical protein
VIKRRAASLGAGKTEERHRECHDGLEFQCDVLSDDQRFILHRLGNHFTPVQVRQRPFTRSSTPSPMSPRCRSPPPLEPESNAPMPTSASLARPTRQPESQKRHAIATIGWIIRSSAVGGGDAAVGPETRQHFRLVLPCRARPVVGGHDRPHGAKIATTIQRRSVFMDSARCGPLRDGQEADWIELAAAYRPDGRRSSPRLANAALGTTGSRQPELFI